MSICCSLAPQQQHGATARFSHGRCDAPVSLYELGRHSLLPFVAAACLDPEAPPAPLPMLGRSFGLSPGTAYSEKTFLNCEGVAVERESAWMSPVSTLSRPTHLDIGEVPLVRSSSVRLACFRRRRHSSRRHLLARHEAEHTDQDV